jgi:hypothetical protein
MVGRGGERLTAETGKIAYHPRWMQFMYALVIAVAGFAGLSGLVAPEWLHVFQSVPIQEPFIAGVAYSMWFALAIWSIAGLRSPLKYTPVLLLVMTYKTVWLLAVVVPHAVSGEALSSSVIFNGVGWIFVIIGCAIAIPWKYVFAK